MGVARGVHDLITALEWKDFAGPVADTLAIMISGGVVIAAVVAFLIRAFTGTLKVPVSIVVICLMCYLGGVLFLTTTVFPYL